MAKFCYIFCICHGYFIAKDCHIKIFFFDIFANVASSPLQDSFSKFFIFVMEQLWQTFRDLFLIFNYICHSLTTLINGGFFCVFAMVFLWQNTIVLFFNYFIFDRSFATDLWQKTTQKCWNGYLSRLSVIKIL